MYRSRMKEASTPTRPPLLLLLNGDAPAVATAVLEPSLTSSTVTMRGFFGRDGPAAEEGEEVEEEEEDCCCSISEKKRNNNAKQKDESPQE